MRQTAKSGYTIVEVLIVLAISTSLLFAAIAVFRGQQEESEFIQAVQDLNSKIINYSSQISAGTFPNSENYSCSPGGAAPPTLSTAGANKELGGRDGCLFLGRAIQVIENSSDIYVYTVIGNVANSSNQINTDIASSLPEPTYRTDCASSFKNPTCWVLTDKYTINSNATVTKAWINGVAKTQPWYMAGIYSSLDANSDSSAGTINLNFYGYNLVGDVIPSSWGAGNIKDCIEATASTIKSCNTLTKQIDTWNICVKDANANHTFLLSIFRSTSGLSTKLTDNGC